MSFASNRNPSIIPAQRVWTNQEKRESKLLNPGGEEFVRSLALQDYQRKLQEERNPAVDLDNLPTEGSILHPVEWVSLKTTSIATVSGITLVKRGVPIHDAALVRQLVDAGIEVRATRGAQVTVEEEPTLAPARRGRPKKLPVE